MKPRQNEKRYHKELVDIVNNELGGYGYKAQRGFIKGVPDVELKIPELPLCKIEVKHEVYVRQPLVVPVNLTQLQRLRLRHMQRANLNCGWAVFVTIDRTTCVYYDVDSHVQQIVLNNLEQIGKGDQWTKLTRVAATRVMLRYMTSPPLY